MPNERNDVEKKPRVLCTITVEDSLKASEQISGAGSRAAAQLAPTGGKSEVKTKHFKNKNKNTVNSGL